MQLRISHTTTVGYDEKATAGLHQARLTPVTTPGQIVVHSRVEITPQPWISEYRDYFGSLVTAFEISDPHDALVVEATCTVQTGRSPSEEATLSWEQMAEREVADRWTEFLMLPPRVQPPEELVERAEAIKAEGGLPGEIARRVCGVVHEQVSTTCRAPILAQAADAWAAGSGTCQDVAHLAIGALRTLGIPARYVSGYSHPDADPQIGTTVRADEHGWIEWWDDAWHGYDPARLCEIGDTYVSVAKGRDHDDATPLAGIVANAEPGSYEVVVEITRID
ncbi:transglutaminase family protein [Nocardioides acrostichi]|uniref:Transglutaminase family protein n=1 Tax=Nocardioides acrostichi TaxID=2784339 RepID=A0A930UYU8_9ACTN|nr:transglutaminase family protein [Nocardioides acrostichi]MBF4160904.1 transglutaminase family protein [Nocardioides acrostichi]